MQDQAADDPETALRMMLAKARKTAMVAGRKHPLWAAIFDAESLLAGTRTAMRFPSREEGMERLCNLLGEYVVSAGSGTSMHRGG